MMFEPSPSTCDSTSCFAPLPIATRTTTAATPMITPSIVRRLRNRLAASASSATRNPSPNLTGRHTVAVGLDDPVTHVDLPARSVGDIAIVGDEQHRYTSLAIELLEDRHDLFAGAGVEVSRSARRPRARVARRREPGQSPPAAAHRPTSATVGARAGARARPPPVPQLLSRAARVAVCPGRPAAARRCRSPLCAATAGTTGRRSRWSRCATPPTRCREARWHRAHRR